MAAIVVLVAVVVVAFMAKKPHRGLAKTNAAAKLVFSSVFFSAKN